jgi:hypothetical protein
VKDGEKERGWREILKHLERLSSTPTTEEIRGAECKARVFKNKSNFLGTQRKGHWTRELEF